ncbi:hypothetical protein KSP40_PGU012220 [Platanthera guangdongensis]|uniref:peptide-methionine (S)-S-oxide reductase n=1 Tax=Platanthera guangdongensis TaxID=2320717 RepID=A0ABR2LN82_9ASPA
MNLILPAVSPSITHLSLVSSSLSRFPHARRLPAIFLQKPNFLSSSLSSFPLRRSPPSMSWLGKLGLVFGNRAGISSMDASSAAIAQGPDGDGPAPGQQFAQFGAGCFWGVELAFQRVPGVSKTEVGYSQGLTHNPTYEDVCTGTTKHAEVVRMQYDPSSCRYEDLLDVFWARHDPTTLNRQSLKEWHMIMEDLELFNNELEYIGVSVEYPVRTDTGYVFSTGTLHSGKYPCFIVKKIKEQNKSRRQQFHGGEEEEFARETTTLPPWSRTEKTFWSIIPVPLPFFNVMILYSLIMQGNDVGSQYRSGIYYYTPEQEETAKESLERQQKNLGRKIVTEILPAKQFYKAEEYHQQYLEKGGRFGFQQSASKGCSDPIRCYG